MSDTAKPGTGSYRRLIRNLSRGTLQVKRNKYRNVPTVVDGKRFASKKEAKRYGELLLLYRAQQIFRLECQRRFPLFISMDNGKCKVIGHYVADFCYIEGGELVIEDTKGVRTALYKWKKKHFEAQYGLVIREI